MTDACSRDVLRETLLSDTSTISMTDAHGSSVFKKRPKDSVNENTVFELSKKDLWVMQ